MRLTSYQGKRAVVTGASSGIGRLLSLRLAREGADVVLVARRRSELEEVAKEVESVGRRALVLPCDVGDREQIIAAAATLPSFGPIDLLVNNAGYGGHHSFLEWDIDDIERMLRVNFLGSVYWTKALLPAMVERRSGWIVMMASVAGKIGVPDESIYVASKFALVGLTEALSMEVENSGVHMLTVCPGAIRTPFFDARALARMPAVAKRLMINPEAVVDAIVAALARGEHEITVPRMIGMSYLVRALAPGFSRWQTKRVTQR